MKLGNLDFEPSDLKTRWRDDSLVNIICLAKFQGNLKLNYHETRLFETKD